MGLGEIRCELECLVDGPPRLGKGGVRSKRAEYAEDGVGLGLTNVGERETGIELDRPIEVCE